MSNLNPELKGILLSIRSEVSLANQLLLKLLPPDRGVWLGPPLKPMPPELANAMRQLHVGLRYIECSRNDNLSPVDRITQFPSLAKVKKRRMTRSPRKKTPETGTGDGPRSATD